MFIAAASPSFKEKDRELIDWYKKEMLDLGIDVKLATEVKDINSLNFDDVIVATGSVPRKLNVKGAEKAIDKYIKDDKVKEGAQKLLNNLFQIIKMNCWI